MIIENEAVLKMYDKVVYATNLNLFSFAKKSGRIVLKDFDIKNKDHLFVFHVATMTSEVFQYPIYIECSLFKKFLINLKIRKKYNKIKRVKSGQTDAVSVPELLDYERCIGTPLLGEDFSFGRIYENFYEGKK